MFSISFLLKTRKKYYDYLNKKPKSSQIQCPDPKILNDLIDDKLLEQERTLIISHLISCLNCVNEIKVIIASKNLSSCKRKKVGHSECFSEYKFPSFSRNKMMCFFYRKKIMLKFSIIFLSLLITASAFIIFHKGSISDLDTLRGSSKIEIFTYNPKKGNVYNSSSLFFNWQELESTEYYIVEIFDSDLKRIWITEKLHVESYFPSNHLRVLIQKNGTYYWMVTAKLSSGIKVESKLIKFKIR